MNQRRLWVAAAIIAVVIIGGFALSVPHTRDIIEPPKVSVISPSIAVATLRDVVKKGVHTISGSVLAPNACSSATASATLKGEASTTQTILVEITVPADSGICLEVPTTVPFQVTLAAPARLALSVMVNGTLATTSTP
jgi:hypothetical protein